MDANVTAIYGVLVGRDTIALMQAPQHDKPQWHSGTLDIFDRQKGPTTSRKTSNGGYRRNCRQRQNTFRMAVEMGCFRMGRWVPRCPMASERKTPFAPGEPEPLAVGFDRLRSEESSLAVSDRAVGPGQQRPSPR